MQKASKLCQCITLELEIVPSSFLVVISNSIGLPVSYAEKTIQK